MLVKSEQPKPNLLYRTTASVPRLKKAIAEIAERDLFHEAEEKKATKIHNIGVLFTIIGFTGALISYTLFEAFPPIATFLIPFTISLFFLGFGTFIWGRIRQKKHQPFNLSQRRYRYESLGKLLEIWKKDLNLSHKLRVSLDLQKRDDKSKLVKQEPFSRHKDGKTDFYRDEWLKVKGQFLDETKFFLQVIERHRVRSWTNVNNKNRTKLIPKGFEIILKLNYLSQRYPNVSGLKDRARSAIKLPATVELKRLEITNRGLTMKVKILPDPQTDNLRNLLFQSIILMFMSAYQTLNLARAMNQQRGA
ncbi:MAG: hypothetical protein SW833_07200 [Cyanobacteriota bacterium]|nr:hypothetical protein [Cyanobacteriota bacterium]